MQTLLRKHALMGLILGACALPAVSAQADTIEKKIVTCAACHGLDGKSSAPIYPNLAGQSREYLDSSLKAYRAGERGGGMSAVMTPQATNLTDKDIAEMAEYYSKQ